MASDATGRMLYAEGHIRRRRPYPTEFREGSIVLARQVNVRSLLSRGWGGVRRFGAGGSDASVLVTEWPGFATLDWAAVKERMPGDLLVYERSLAHRVAVTYTASPTMVSAGEPSGEAQRTMCRA